MEVDISDRIISCSSGRRRLPTLQLVVERGDDDIDKDTIHMVTSGLTVEQALYDGDVALLRDSIISKVEPLNSHNVFRQVGKVTVKIISTKFVLMRKLNKKEKAERYKTRLVAQGFFQWLRFDFNIESTYTSTIDHTVLQLLLTIVPSEKLEILQCDVKTTYLEEELDLPIMVQLTKELSIEDDENACFSYLLIAGKSSQVVQLVKALPGLW